MHLDQPLHQACTLKLDACLLLAWRRSPTHISQQLLPPCSLKPATFLTAHAPMLQVAVSCRGVGWLDSLPHALREDLPREGGLDRCLPECVGFAKDHTQCRGRHCSQLARQSNCWAQHSLSSANNQPQGAAAEALAAMNGPVQAVHRARNGWSEMTDDAGIAFWVVCHA